MARTRLHPIRPSRVQKQDRILARKLTLAAMLPPGWAQEQIALYRIRIQSFAYKKGYEAGKKAALYGPH